MARRTNADLRLLLDGDNYEDDPDFEPCGCSCHDPDEDDLDLEYDEP